MPTPPTLYLGILGIVVRFARFARVVTQTPSSAVVVTTPASRGCRFVLNFIAGETNRRELRGHAGLRE